MLKKVEITCFRKHESLEVTFTDGLNVLRAPNEGGKTTLLEAISYALFGASTLRNSLDETVTWGRKASELKVSILWDDYVITRSKSGAEVVSMGQVFVTGQSEVTKFCEKLVGAKAKLADSLMFSSQMGLRGILTGGPTATASLIEELGEFDLFDRILDAAEAKLALGSSTAQDERLRGLQGRLASMPTDVAAPSVEKFEAEMSAHTLNFLTLSSAKDQMEQVLAGRRNAVSALDLKQAAINSLSKEKGRIEDQIRTNQLALATVKAKITGEEVDTSDLESQIAGAGELVKRKKAWDIFSSLTAYEPHDRAQWLLDEKNNEKRIKELETAAHAEAKNIAVAKAKMTTSSVCGICKQDVSQFPEVAQRNAELEAEIARCDKAIKVAEEEWEGLIAKRGEFNKVTNRDVESAKAVRPIQQYVTVNDSFIPATYSFNGSAPQEVPDVNALSKELDKVKLHNNNLIKNKAELKTFEGVVERLKVQLKTVVDELNSADSQYSEQEHADLRMSISTLELEINDISIQISGLRLVKSELAAKFEKDTRDYETYVSGLEDLKRRIAETEKEVETLQFNNTLVKKVKAARPIVGNKLWEMVLASVSNIFTSMRGEQSVVTKGKDGFRINGQALASYSGSTIDLLGLAVRGALTKTFIPDCKLLILDEPSAACDQDRTNSMLGYVAGCGFKQVLLVTHNEASESFASNVIRL